MKKILIIEDDDVIRNNTAEMLRFAEYEVITAENGKIGIDLALKEIPDLIVCDIAMPVMDGYEVIYLLSKNTNTTNIPFIFLTAKTEKADWRKGMSLGADDYLFKPFEEMDLLSAIETRLKKSERFKREFSRDIAGLNQFLLSAKGTDELKKLPANRKVKKLKNKDMIYMEDDEANNVFFINSGSVKTFNLNKEGKELVTGLHRQGDFIGALDLLESEVYRETAVAIEDTDIVLIPKRDFFSLIYSQRDVALRFVHMLSNNINELKERLLDLAYGSLRKRMANALLSIQKKYSSGDAKKETLTISRENLASIIGITPESVSRTLHDFKDEKLIDIKNKQIVILNREKLAGMKN